MSFLDFGLSSWPGSGNREPEYGMEFGSVTLKRIGFFVFQLNTQHTLRGNVIISKAAQKAAIDIFYYRILGRYIICQPRCHSELRVCVDCLF